jgi:hypothetical protein
MSPGALEAQATRLWPSRDARLNAAALAVNERALERHQTANSWLRCFDVDGAPPSLSRLALIFRVLLNETQAQSRFTAYTRNITELGISTENLR